MSKKLFDIVEILSCDKTIYHLRTPYEVGDKIVSVAKDLGYDLSKEDMAFVAYWIGHHHASKHETQSHWDKGMQ